MTQRTNTGGNNAGAIVLMFVAAMGIVWIVYSSFFQQGVLTFLILLVYIPAVGVIALLLYRKLRRRPKADV